MKLSEFGRKLTADTGIVNLMEDLAEALNVNPDILFMGGGNPAQIPAFEREVADHLKAIVNNPERVHKLVGVYQSPRGSEFFINAFVGYVNDRFGWNIKSENVAVTNGSQSAFFILFNILAGKTETHKKKIVFPMMPEYLGYSGQGGEVDVFRSYRPNISQTDEHRFKYHVDFDALQLLDNDGALCVSRPTNPTGNVLSSDEMEKLSRMAKQSDIPFIVDCAYGEPFPDIIYGTETLPFDLNNIYVVSCSKLGLPGARTGIVIGPEDIIERVVKANTIMSLANGNFGPSLVTSLIEKGDMENICRNTLLPFYRKRRDHAIACIEKYLSNIPYMMHEPEGAFFLWLWLPQLSVSSTEFYQRMKAKGVLVMDGSHFFFGIDPLWSHTKQCIRLTYCQSEEVIEKAIALLGEELRICE